MPASGLTIVVPTRNRARLATALVRFLRDNGVTHNIIVADSSEGETAEAVHSGCSPYAEVVAFDPRTTISSKLIRALEKVPTEHVVMLPDDDLTFPHAIEASYRYLLDHPDFVAAQGYVLDLATEDKTFDVTGVHWFVPSVDQETPLERIYHLVRRYQPFLWAVFRTDVILKALRAGYANPRIVFQEMTIMNGVVAQGKLARLRNIYTLRGPEESLSALPQTHPLYAFITDSDGFFADYARYRQNLARFIKSHCSDIDLPGPTQVFAPPGVDAPPPASLAAPGVEHVLNLIHGILFAGEADRGMLNYTVQLLLGGQDKPIPIAPQSIGVQPLDPADRLVDLDDGARLIWRKAVFTAEPRDEIEITSQEVETVERAIRHYRL